MPGVEARRRVLVFLPRPPVLERVTHYDIDVRLAGIRSPVRV
jgi:hypothetical protein